ncbi:tetraspanin-8-like [Scomber japonicus]|uniref:tetraspanin-8-like n=1 Tax=Scomber japonicus TaxID=13676 RepID=UPI0023054942|nr:tetraspanin-8-like [Scomber japonicus]
MAASNVVRYLFFSFNLLFFVGGSITLGLSVHARNNKLDYQITDDNTLPAVNLLIVISAVTLIFGFLGCCGAIRNNRCLLAVFFFTGLFLMFLMMLAVGILGALSSTVTAQEVVTESLQQLLPLSQQPKTLIRAAL